MKISQILDKIDDGQLFVPAFQREYVWKKNDVKALLNSLINEYPTGTILTWETRTPPELKGSVSYNDNMGAVKLILDGQQRITSLYLIIRDKIPPYYEEKDILNDVRRLYVNLDTLELNYYMATIMEKNPLWVDLTNIFQGGIKPYVLVKQLSELGQMTDDLEDRIHSNFHQIESVLSFDFLEQTIPIKANISQAIDIFYIVNASGVNLTDAELALAQISGYWPKARDVIKEKMFSLKETGFDFRLDFFIYVLLGVIHHSGKSMKKLHGKENEAAVKEVWTKLNDQVLDYVLNLLKSHAYIDHSKEINSVFALIPIIVFAYEHNCKMSEKRIKKAIKWFYYSQLRQRYISNLQNKLDQDIAIIVSSKNPFDELLANIQSERTLEVSPDEFTGVGVSHPLFSTMRWYFKSKNAVCLTTGIKLRKNMGKKYELENDHIFPWSALRDNGYGKSNKHKYQLAQEITNKALLTSIANKKKSNQPAFDYLLDIKQNYPNALELQCIPEDEELWKLDNYESFLSERRQLLANNINSWLGGITDMVSPELAISIEELIYEGESSNLEFKSSLKWDYNESKVNTVLERAVLKTIAAFNNTDGGSLFIGVDDDGNILGLDRDYDTLRKQDKDGFDLYLRDKITSKYGIEFATTSIKLIFHEIDEMEVCEVEVLRGEKRLYLEVKDKNGQKDEKFYVRRGNASVEIERKSEISEYVSNRF